MKDLATLVREMPTGWELYHSTNTQPHDTWVVHIFDTWGSLVKFFTATTPDAALQLAYAYAETHPDQDIAQKSWSAKDE